MMFSIFQDGDDRQSYRLTVLHRWSGQIESVLSELHEVCMIPYRGTSPVDESPKLMV